MTIDLYMLDCENERVNKPLGEPTQLTGYMLDDTSVVNPSIEIEYTPNTHFNYCYISDLSRYYFIKNITITSNNTMIIDLHCDVLMTYKNELLDHNAIIERQENRYNLYLDDSMYKAYQNRKIQFKKLSGAMPSMRMFLMVNGGGLGVVNI